MSKNIVLLSDGTGNSSSKLFKTNVWRLFQALDLTRPDRQVAYYDNGVGTSSFKLFAILGGVFGFGLARNVVDIYSFCCRNYNSGDKIYGFGFSRGAFTIRVVAGLIATVGLIKYSGDERDLAAQARAAYRQYRRRFHTGTRIERPLRWLRDLFVTLLNPNKVVPVEKIHFLGVWDTVDAYGGPIEEITRAIDYWIWPLSMPDRFMSIKINRACHALALEEERESFRPIVWDGRYARDADAKLHPMQPPGWKPDIDTAKYSAAIDQMRLSQVWFVGVHSDIGGGYPQDGLSYFTLNWMMDRAIPYGLELLAPIRDELALSANPYDRLNDSRHGLAGYYRYKPRDLGEIYNASPYKPAIGRDIKYLTSMFSGKNEHQEEEVKHQFAAGTTKVSLPDPMIHLAVLDRVFRGTDGYAPIVLPANYLLTDEAGHVYPPINQNKETIALNPESGELIRLDEAGQVRPFDSSPSSRQRADEISADPALQAKFLELESGTSRFNRQQHAWNWVWWRRIVYFLTVFASLFLAAMPLFEKWKPGLGAASSFELIRPIFSLVAMFVPSFLSAWLDAFKNAPGWFVIGAAVAAILLFAGGSAQGTIREIMRQIWRTPEIPGAKPTDLIYTLRSSRPYRAFFYVLKHWLLPFVVAVLLWLCILIALYFVPALVSRAVFGTANALGYICVSKGGVEVTGAESKPFLTSDVCASTGFAVNKGATYGVVIKVTSPWIDDYHEGKPGGIPTDPRGFGWSETKPLQYLGVPYRRLMWSNWFSPVLRVGSNGFEEHLLDIRQEKTADGAIYTATFLPQKDGEVFIFVNDSVLGLPWIYDYFYSNNAGAATVTLRKQ
jgi:uncharacterized protein (DUF2235 family)